MKRFLIRAAICCSTFILGIACAGIWISKPSPVTQIPSNKCVRVYDAALLNQKLNEIDDPQLFRAFQELPLYAMPDCVDEAYSLTWIPSFHQPVLVRVWRVGDEFFMIGKSLDSRGWSEFGFGNVKESNERSLTKSEW